MKKLTLLIVLCILAVGIVANANIQPLDNSINGTGLTQIQSSINTDSKNSEPTTNPATVSILLGVGIVGFVTFSRRR